MCHVKNSERLSMQFEHFAAKNKYSPNPRPSLPPTVYSSGTHSYVWVKSMEERQYSHRFFTVIKG